MDKSSYSPPTSYASAPPAYGYDRESAPSSSARLPDNTGTGRYAAPPGPPPRAPGAPAAPTPLQGPYQQPAAAYDPYPPPSAASGYPPPAGPPPAYTDDDADVLLHAFLATPPPDRAALRPLPLPFCLPQTASASDAPFLRGWCDALGHSGVRMQDWLGFVDGLNMAMSASPPLRVLGIAGNILGLVPYHWAMIAGISMQAGAAAGTRAVSKTLTDRYLRTANSAFFAPRGLRVRLCSTAAARRIVGTAGHGAGGALAGAGRTALKIGLHLPVARVLINRVMPAPAAPAPAGSGPGSSTLAARCLAGLGAGTGAHALPVRTDALPPPARAEGVLDQAGALGMKMDAWRAERRAQRRARRGRGADGGEDAYGAGPSRGAYGGGYGAPPPPSQPSGSRRQVRREQRREARHERRAERGERRGQQKADIASRLEALSTEDALWLVLLDAAQDAALHGTEQADADGADGADTVVLSEDELRRELALERKHDAETEGLRAELEDDEDDAGSESHDHDRAERYYGDDGKTRRGW